MFQPCYLFVNIANLFWSGFIVNAKSSNKMRMCYSVTPCSYIIISLVLVYQWNENIFSILIKANIVLLFFIRFLTLYHVSLVLRQKAHRLYVFEKRKVSFCIFCEENKSIKIQMLAWKVKLSRLLLQHITEFKIHVNETSHNTPNDSKIQSFLDK